MKFVVEIEHARNDHLVVRQPDLAEHDPLVLVARVGALEGEALRAGPGGRRG